MKSTLTSRATLSGGDWLPVFLALCTFLPGPARAQAYFLENFQYFRPIIADVRTSQNHLRLYKAPAVPFSNSTSEGNHWFIDSGFGERFSFLGYSFRPPNPEPLRNAGVSLFVDGASHLLIDLNTKSRDVINADYRIGMGLALRPPFWSFLALRGRFIHESSHLGDEYSLFASRQAEFRRFNVSYEAAEVYAAVDRPAPGLASGQPQQLISYVRAFAGLRHLYTKGYDGFTGQFEPAGSIFLVSQKEFHVGGEMYFRGWPMPDQRAGAGWWSGLLSFQNVFIATDFKRENRLDPQTPERVWSVNAIVGVIYGEAFARSGGRTVRWELSYYNGINPHGQFRKDDLSYWGFNFVIDF